MHGLRRKGMSTLVGVLILVAVLTLVGIFQHDLSRRSLGEVHRIQLAALARQQARGGIQELLDQVAAGVNDPTTKIFRTIREQMDERWGELDLAPSLEAPTASLAPNWGKLGAEPEGRAIARVTEFTARIRGTRASFDVRPTEEWTGVLTLAVTAEVSDAASTMYRQIEESYEIRTVLIGVPRPFDQLGFMVGDLSSLTDVDAVNRRRRELIEGQDALLREVAASDPMSFTAEEAARLKAIAEGMLPTEEVAKRTLELPTEPAVAMGFYHVEEMPLEHLDLARLSSDDRDEAQAKASAMRAARPAGGSPLVEAVYQTVDAYSNALTRIWSYQRTMTIVRKDEPRFQETIAPFLPRLSPEFFVDRVSLALDAEGRLFKAWREGDARLDGVIDLRGARRKVVLSGELKGKVILLVGQEGAYLEDLNQDSAQVGTRLVVVAMGGDVTVRGDVSASVISLPVEGGDPSTAGRITVGHNSKLRGALLAPHASRSDLELDGFLLHNPNGMAVYPPKDTLYRPWGGEYVVTVSPDPLFTEGRAVKGGSQ